MLFGFVAAAIAGFLLTAVPSWTGRRGFAGPPVVLLTATWAAARLLIATSNHWPAVLVAAADDGFLVTVGILIAPSLLRANNRNTPLLLMLGSLAACNATFHWAVAHQDAVLAHHSIIIGIDISLLLVLQWRSLATWRQPIVWILHLGYVWLPIGLALKCVAVFSGSAVSAFRLHSLTIGVLSTMIMGVMTRASLGHTGRPLVVAPSTHRFSGCRGWMANQANCANREDGGAQLRRHKGIQKR